MRITEKLGFARETSLVIGAAVASLLSSCSVSHDGEAADSGDAITDAQLMFSVPPTATNAGQLFSPAITVEVKDGTGNLVTSGNPMISIAIGNNPSGGSTLGGTTSVEASGGLATFSDLTVSFGGQGLTLVATATDRGPVIGSVTSTPFTVIGPNAIITATVPPMPGKPGYDDFMTFVAPHIQAVAPLISWNQIDKGSEPCDEASTCDFTAIDKELKTFVEAGLKINLLVQPVSEGYSNNTATPAYVYSEAYASFLGAADQDQVVCEGWYGDGKGVPLGSTSEWAVWNTKACMAHGPTACPAPAAGGYTNKNGFPVLYEKPFMTAYQHFIAQVIKHYSNNSQAPGNGAQVAAYIGAHMNYIRFGMAEGAENEPMCVHNWPGPTGLALAAPPGQYTPDMYLTQLDASGQPGYMKSMLALEQSENQKSTNTTRQITVNTHTVSQDLSYADTEADLANEYGIGFGMEALTIGDEYNYTNHTGACADDWCANFDKYPSSLLFLQTVIPLDQPIYELASVTSTDGVTAIATPANGQPDFYRNIPLLISGNSNPEFNGLFKTVNTQQQSDPGADFAMNANGEPGSGSGGSLMSSDYLPLTLTFAMQHNTKAFELFSCDLFYAFVLNPTLPTIKCDYLSVGLAPNGPYTPQYASTITTISGKP